MIRVFSRDSVSELVRDVAFTNQLTQPDRELLEVLGFYENDQLTPTGRAFEEAVWIYEDESTLARLWQEALLGIPETQALLQGLHGRGPVSFGGTHHFMARHQLADRNDPVTFRHFLTVLNAAGIVSYSNKMQTVRGVAPVPALEEASLRVVEPERPYSNVLALRETLRACEAYIWWAEVHLDQKVLKPLSYEADGSKISEIRLLSGPARVSENSLRDFKRFEAEMNHKGIAVEWRVIAKSDVDWHDRFILAKNQAWNVPPVNTLYKGDYSQLARTTERPPFESWWSRGVPLASWLAANALSA